VDEAAFEEAMQAVNGLVGLPSAKRSISRLADFARIEAERRRLKLPQSQIGFNCVFTGAPGTGKTTVARLIGKIMKALGLLESGHTIEVDKSGLVGGYLGETPLKVRKAFDRADGGVLFVDEAYSLSHDTDDLYGREAIDGLVKQMEDRRSRVVVIVAGYPQEMRKFIASNPGLRSRFNRTIVFDDLDAEELLAVQKQMLRSAGFDASEGFWLRSELLWQTMCRDRLTFDGNARLVRSALEIALENQAGRLVRNKRKERHELCELTPEDLDGVEAQLRKEQDA
jgi:SpoVK/Ycf46/Vps4 family AAA+-type ATPase